MGQYSQKQLAHSGAPEGEEKEKGTEIVLQEIIPEKSQI